MAKDLHQFLEEYKEKEPTQVIEIDREISSEQEVTAIVLELEKQQKYPILIFNNIVHPNGHKAKFPLVMNLLGSRQRCADAMGVSYDNAGTEYFRRTRLNRIDPVTISKSEAPVKEVIYKGDEVNLFDIPAIKHFNSDPGSYISAGELTTADPDTGIDNTSLQRGWIVGPREIRCYLAKHTHNMLNFRKYEKMGKNMPVAYWVGHHPSAYLGGQARLGYPESHYAAMGGLMGEPLRVVPSETFGEELLVPADAEIVIEGYLEAGERYPEGPFGEYTGYTGPQIPNPKFIVTAVTQRKNPYWMNFIVGTAGGQQWGNYVLEGLIYEIVKNSVPTLQKVHLPLSAQGRFHVYLQFKDPRPGDAREAIMQTLTIDPRIKHVFTFDDDIDIHDEAECLFALATRTQWDRDVMVFPNTRSVGLDPSADEDSVTTKGGIDCTMPAGRAYSNRNAIDKEVAERIKAVEYIDPNILNQVKSEKL
ncbi:MULTISPECIES: UbiD family decarboxylase [unclassified Paenibacillus]|uniref:UbiD family decarboxylase n=1 Tax=unclassified Paenibacillus TaxID=185978 RepID=UPI001AE4C32E|nr:MULTISPECIES: UbiD family decarboxylase [unclassified Paenibacillus]MBP1154284.1 2,5-furandicarboxylate decarboxylase 1 [Paenibacillus sp. PvP091]MBP1170331.1 2,5-furandicarboxylate decarboxylase 1 [Paenibacillus sp. PvR098]MBP2441359.1 2,5-furandicarboxylate decarboxylase 1 [Paenibacillus sp. PvP052]